MTANPLAATRVPDQGPAYVAIIPMASAVPGSQWTIASGYGAAEDAQVHTLSEIVLKLAATKFIVNSLIRTIVLVVNLARGAPNTGLTVFLWLFWVSWACYVYWLGIQGVKTRNAPCCGDACCCANSGCGSLTAFFGIYVFFASLHGIALLIDLVTLNVVGIFVSLFFVALTGATAEYARRLLDRLASLPRRGGDVEAGPPLPVAAAHEVQVGSVAPPPVVVSAMPVGAAAAMPVSTATATPPPAKGDDLGNTATV